MKNFPIVLFLFLLLVSCNNGGAQKSTERKHDGVVGTFQSGAYTVADEAYFKEQWEAALHKNGVHSPLAAFAILKTTTTGDAVRDCYMLTAKTKDNNTMVASLLVKQGNNLYFDKKNHISTICAGRCAHGCNPVAIVKKYKVQLVCLNCADCVKTEVDMDFY